jgi:hypothetical protein
MPQKSNIKSVVILLEASCSVFKVACLRFVPLKGAFHVLGIAGVLGSIGDGKIGPIIRSGMTWSVGNHSAFRNEKRDALKDGKRHGL